MVDAVKHASNMGHPHGAPRFGGASLGELVKEFFEEVGGDGGAVAGGGADVVDGAGFGGEGGAGGGDGLRW